MELFKNAKTVRLKSHHEKYLQTDDSDEHVIQDRNGATRGAARWSVEFPDHSNAVIRLKSCGGRYLTASNEPMFLGMTGHRVTLTAPHRVDSSVDWEPIRDGFQVRLKTRYGQYLRANGGVPPWRNSITHDIPHRTTTQDWVLWDVEVVEVLQHQKGREKQQETKIYAPPPPPPEIEERWGEPLTEDTPSRIPSISEKSPRRLSRDEV